MGIYSSKHNFDVKVSTSHGGQKILRSESAQGQNGRVETKGFKLPEPTYVLWSVKKEAIRKSLEREVNPRRVSIHGEPQPQAPGHL